MGRRGDLDGFPRRLRAHQQLVVRPAPDPCEGLADGIPNVCTCTGTFADSSQARTGGGKLEEGPGAVVLRFTCAYGGGGPAVTTLANFSHLPRLSLNRLQP